MTISPTTEGERDWTRRASCRGAVAVGAAADHEFFPELEVDTRWREVRDRFCDACPVRAECFLFALKHRYVGLWGGELLTAPSLARFRRHYGIAA